MTTTDSAPSQRAGDDAFPITWEHPGDAGLTWDWDDMHMPFALTPLAEDYVRVLALGFNLAYELFGDFPQRILGRVWNGYAYFAYTTNVPEAERPALAERWAAVARARAEVTERYWTDEVLPEIKQLEQRLRELATDRVAASDLIAAWDEAWAATDRLWKLHFLIIRGPYSVTEDLATAYEAIVPEAAPGEALRLIQGARHELFDVEVGMERLATLAAALPDVAAALAGARSVDGHGPRTMGTDFFMALDGGATFLAELEAFLVRHGHLGQPFDDLSYPSWADDPSILLGELATRLENAPEAAESRRSRLAAQADALADAARSRLADRPDELGRFEHLLTLARAIGPLTEIHNYWIDRMAQARLRRFSIRVGATLVEARCIDAAEDVFHLHRAEVRALIEEPRDARGLITARRAEHARRRTLTPPRRVGMDSGPAEVDRFDGARYESDDVNVLRGTGASAGVVRGIARVTLGPADFARIRRGDIIVCPSSNPSWVPVFTIAGGLVTNTGGVLSHAAVVAREFGLPAVVGTGDATTRIADGRTVEIDGTTGYVRLL